MYIYIWKNFEFWSFNQCCDACIRCVKVMLIRLKRHQCICWRQMLRQTWRTRSKRPLSSFKISFTTSKCLHSVLCFWLVVIDSCLRFWKLLSRSQRRSWVWCGRNGNTGHRLICSKAWLRSVISISMLGWAAGAICDGGHWKRRINLRGLNEFFWAERVDHDIAIR